MASVVYCLCGFTSALVAILLIRAYRRTRLRLLLWSSLCFSLLMISNGILVMDLVVFPDLDLTLARTVPGFLGVGVMLFGLIWESH